MESLCFGLLVFHISVLAACRECTCNEPSRYVLIHSRGLMRFVARPRWWGWCVSTMTWGDAGWSFPWQIWMLCPPFTHQTGWDCLQVTRSRHWRLSHKFRSLQSIPENGSPEVSPDLTQQPAAQTPTSVPSQNASPPIQPGQGPASLSPQQVLLANASKLWIWIILEWNDLEKALIWEGQMSDYVYLCLTSTSVSSNALIW